MSDPLNTTTTTAILAPARRAVWRYVGGLAPVVVLWAVLAGWLAWQLYERSNWSDEADEASVREWLDEARNFRKTLPDLVREYVKLRADPAADPSRAAIKRDELEEHMRSLAEPTRLYANQLPLFPEIYSLTVQVAGGEAIVWASSVPRPQAKAQNPIRTLSYDPVAEVTPVRIVCEYRLHAFNKLQRREEDRQQTALVAGALLVTATILAALFVSRFLSRERQREVARLTAVAESEHTMRELLQAQLAQQAAEERQRELGGRLLQQQLEATDLKRRTAEAENAALEMKSQLYASIGIMAGSYAHNIKNLLVRPNDLLARCIEVNGLSHEQEGMLSEVKSTLGTVTERLQQILRTVRRDPNQTSVAQVDLNQMVRDTVATWTDLGRDKWKLRIAAEAAGPLRVTGDSSHLQQAIENLLFNARDATFEMRNHLREEARTEALDPATRKQKLIEAASWKGDVRLATRATADGVVLEVRDNGIGMTPEVRANCLTTHFSTKRDNALYEGYSAGMGLGLSFVAVVLSHHAATLAIESEPRAGAVFRITFPAEVAAA